MRDVFPSFQITHLSGPSSVVLMYFTFKAAEYAIRYVGYTRYTYTKHTYVLKTVGQTFHTV